MQTITRTDFEQVELRIGTIIDIQPFPEARKPAYKLTIDFWPEVGIKKSSAQITDHYTPDQLINTQILGVVNFPPKQIWIFMSECLVTGLYDTEGKVILIRPDQYIKNGSKLW
jgi:tRNA-binding protein